MSASESSMNRFLRDLAQSLRGAHFLGISELETHLPPDFGVDEIETVLEFLDDLRVVLVEEDKGRPVGYHPQIQADERRRLRRQLTQKDRAEEEVRPAIGGWSEEQQLHQLFYPLADAEDLEEDAGEETEDDEESLDVGGLYFQELQGTSRLSPEEEQRLAVRSYEGDEEARRILLDSHLVRVVAMAKKYHRAGAHMDDLIQVGNLGLIEALESYIPGGPLSFRAFSSRVIRKTLGRHLSEERRTIRVPRGVDKQIRILLGVHERLTRSLERSPTREELAEALDVPGDKVDHLMSFLQAPLSLEAPARTGEALRLEETIGDPNAPAPSEHGLRIGALRRLEEALEDFSTTHHRVLALRYGLVDGRTHSRKEVALQVALDLEEVDRIEAEALEALRERKDFLRSM